MFLVLICISSSLLYQGYVCHVEVTLAATIRNKSNFVKYLNKKAGKAKICIVKMLVYLSWLQIIINIG